MSNPSPISDIVISVKQMRRQGYYPSVVKMREETLQEIFRSEEGRDIANKYVPCADTLSKLLSKMLSERITVEIENQAAPDKVYISA